MLVAVLMGSLKIVRHKISGDWSSLSSNLMRFKSMLAFLLVLIKNQAPLKQSKKPKLWDLLTKFSLGNTFGQECRTWKKEDGSRRSLAWDEGVL